MFVIKTEQAELKIICLFQRTLHCAPNHSYCKDCKVLHIHDIYGYPVLEKKFNQVLFFCFFTLSAMCIPNRVDTLLIRKLQVFNSMA